MSKLFKLKDWHSIPDAARNLSDLFGESLSEADVPQLGLNGKLVLSVNLVNTVKWRFGRPMPIAEWMQTKSKLKDLFTQQLNNADSPSANLDSAFGVRQLQGLPAEGEFIFEPHSGNTDDGKADVCTLGGVWHLPMMGTERLSVESRYHQLTGGPAVTTNAPVGWRGALVSRDDGEMAELYERDSSADPARRYLHPDNYHPLNELPGDGVLVVRTSSLIRLLSGMVGQTPRNEAKESTREKNTLLRIIGLMANHRYSGDIGKPFAIAHHLTEKAKELRVAISDDTIAKHLKAAADLIDAEKR